MKRNYCRVSIQPIALEEGRRYGRWKNGGQGISPLTRKGPVSRGFESKVICVVLYNIPLYFLHSFHLFTNSRGPVTQKTIEFWKRFVEHFHLNGKPHILNAGYNLFIIFQKILQPSEWRLFCRAEESIPKEHYFESLQHVNLLNK